MGAKRTKSLGYVYTYIMYKYINLKVFSILKIYLQSVHNFLHSSNKLL